MKKTLVLSLFLGLLVLAGCTPKTEPYQPVTPETTQITGETPSAKLAPGTTLDVAAHADATSCWTTISGEVYDLTSFIGKHPGGDKAILSVCGKDGTTAFDAKHGMDPQKWEGLKQFLIK